MKTPAIVIAAVALLLITEATLFIPAMGTPVDLDAPDTYGRTVMSKPDLSPELKEALKKVQNLLVSKFKETRRTPIPVEESELALKGMFIETDDGLSIQLSNVKLTSVPSIDITSSDPNLEFLNMAVDIEVGPLEVVGHFHMLSSETLVENLNETSGEFTLKYAGVKVTGIVGLSLERNVFSTINYDVVYQPSGTKFTVSYPEKNNGIDRVLDVPDQQEAKIVENINHELKYVLNRIVKIRLDDVLKVMPLERLFTERQNIVSYRKYATELTVFRNKIVDSILSKVNSYIKERGLSQLLIPDIGASSTKKLLGIRWHGSFRTSDCRAEYFDTFTRIGSYSIKHLEGSAFEAFGSVRLSRVKVGCKYRAEFMGIGPSGTLSATAGRNSIFLKVKIDLFKTPAVTFKDVQTEYIKDIKVYVAGLGDHTWLVSKILTSVADEMNKDIKELIDGQLQNYLPEILEMIRSVDILG